MAISINHKTYVIFVPRDDLTLVQSSPVEIRQMDINWFRLSLKDLEDDEEGMTLPDTHNHYAPVSVGGVTLARVIELLPPYTVTFEDGQYAVNLTGANSNIGDRVNVNQVSVRSANSAGLVQTTEIEYASFQNGVWVDQLNGVSGTVYPAGTALRPVATFADAKIIADFRGLKRLYIVGSATMGADAPFDTFEILGQSANLTALNILPTASVQNCEIRECYVMGTLDGGSILRECIVTDLAYVNGVIHQCMLNPGTITLGGGPDAGLYILDCYSGSSGPLGHTDINMGGDGPSLTVRGFNGSIGVRNKTGSSEVSLDINSGYVALHDTVISGNIVIRGVGHLDDYSNGAIVNSSYLLSPSSASEAVWAHSAALQMIANLNFLKGIEGGKWAIINNQMVFYGEDNVTELARFDLLDANGAPTTQNPMSRVRV